MATPTLLKQSTAQRQLDAAIRMFFLHNEDILAIHTLASAARGVVEGLANDRRVGNVVDTEAVLEVYYREHRGVDTTDPSVVEEIQRRAKFIEKGKTANNKENKTAKYRNRVANFLKHADLDPHGHLAEDDVNPIFQIMHSMQLWRNINLELSAEMLVFGQWYLFVNDHADPAAAAPLEKTVGFGRELLKEAYVRDGRSAVQFRDDTSLSLAQLARPTMYTALE